MRHAVARSPGLSAAAVLTGLLAALCSLTPALAMDKRAWPETFPLLELAGVDAHLEVVHAMVLDRVRSRAAALPAEQRSRLVNAADEAYAPTAMREVVVATLNARMRQGHARTVLEFLRSERGRRITALERAAGAEPEETLPTLMDVSQARLTLVRRLDAATGATDLAVDVALDLARAQAVVRGQADPAAAGRDMERQRKSLHAAMAQRSLQAVLRTYASLSDHELGAYVAFLESPAGRWFHHTTALALRAAMATAAVELGERTRNLPGTLRHAV